MADARYRRSGGEIERPIEQWRPGQNVADAVVQRVHERQVWDETRKVLGVMREVADRRQCQEWGELYQRQEGPAGPELEERQMRARVALGREHGREARELDELAARKHREAVEESPIRADAIDQRVLVDELARMARELPEADRAALDRQLQQPVRVTGGFER